MRKETPRGHLPGRRRTDSPSPVMLSIWPHQGNCPDIRDCSLIVSGWTDPADTQRNIDWTRELFAAWEPHLARAAYVNDLGDEGGGPRPQCLRRRLRSVGGA
jgi:hypothetical protein